MYTFTGMNRILPNAEQRVYGQEMYEDGYKTGYTRNTYDRRRRMALKEKALHLKYGSFLDFLDDTISRNKRK